MKDICPESFRFFDQGIRKAALADPGMPAQQIVLAKLHAHLGKLLADGMNQELSANGELVSAQGLAGPEEAKVIRAAKDGSPITDGVFPESKEFLAGYWIVDVDSPQEAYDIAARASAAPGPGGKPLNMPIEVREVMSGPPPIE